MQVKCKVCKNPWTVDVTEKQIRAWEDGELIQNAMPDVPLELRELFITGICPICWDEMMGD